MFADMSDLGYDTTMEPVVRSHGLRTGQYDITVRHVASGEEATYRSEQLVSNISAESVRGRATRVWKVRSLDANGEPVGPIKILKDCWIDEDRKREGTILAKISESATTEK